MILLRSRSTILTLGLATLLTGSLIVACTGDEATTPDATPDASSTDTDATTTPPGDDDGSTPDPENDAGVDPTTDADTSEDAATDIDASDDPDASVDPDAGTDAGGGTTACNELKPGKENIDVTCSLLGALDTPPSGVGGALVAGDYALTNVTVFKKGKACSPPTFNPTVHGGALTLKGGKVGSFTASYVITTTAKEGAGKPEIYRFEQVWTPGKGNAPPAAVQNSCPAGTDGTLNYTSAAIGKLQKLSFYAPYGKDTALYEWTKNAGFIPPL